MKILSALLIVSILCYGINAKKALECWTCLNPLTVDCAEQELLKCANDSDSCIVYYDDRIDIIWKQCIAEEFVKDCKQKNDGIYCLTCSDDGCNNLTYDDMVNIVLKVDCEAQIEEEMAKRQEEIACEE